MQDTCSLAVAVPVGVAHCADVAAEYGPLEPVVETNHVYVTVPVPPNVEGKVSVAEVWPRSTLVTAVGADAVASVCWKFAVSVILWLPKVIVREEDVPL
jgi:hypothetical protein